MRGFIKLHRSEISGPMGQSDELLGFWTRLKSAANHKTGWFKGQEIKPGQLILSDRAMRDRLYHDQNNAPAVNTIKLRLAMLEQCGAITIEARPGRNGGRLVTINASEFDANADANADANTGANAGADSRRGRTTKNGEKARPQSVDDVAAFAKTLDRSKYRNAVQCAEPFFDHYTANGWRQGKGTGRPVKDWKALFRSWVRRQGDFSSNGRDHAEAKTIRFDPRDAI